jgi:hypothetical protein
MFVPPWALTLPTAGTLMDQQAVLTHEPKDAPAAGADVLEA